MVISNLNYELIYAQQGHYLIYLPNYKFMYPYNLILIKKRIFIPIFLFLFCNELSSQIDNSTLFFNQITDTTEENKLYIKIQNFNFLKNNEYFSSIADGYTLFGIQFHPQIGYKFSKNLSLETGVYINKDFGNPVFQEITPTFSLRYSKNNFKMIFGNLDGSIQHQLIEPIYNFERVITNRLENGAQFLINKNWIDIDVWIDWQRMTYKLKGPKEKFWTGININLFKINVGNFCFSMPLQGTALHQGGQIDTSKGNDLTNFNYSSGIKIKYNINSEKIKSLELDSRVVGVNNTLFDPLDIKKSFGFMGNIGLNAFKTNFIVSYWYSTDFVNDFGGYLYSSKSSTVWNPNAYEKYRSLLIFKINKKIELAPHVILTLRAEPYLDLNLNLFEYSYGFYITVDEQLWLNKKIKPVLTY